MAKNNFYIDRQFGIAIWIDVHNGIVKDCHNGGTGYDQRMNENYAGKPISFLKEDFEKRMWKDGGTYHCVHSNDITSQKQIIEALRTRMNNASIQMTRYEISEEEKLKFKKTIEKLQIRNSKAEFKLEEIRERVERVHKFKFN